MVTGHKTLLTPSHFSKEERFSSIPGIQYKHSQSHCTVYTVLEWLAAQWSPTYSVMEAAATSVCVFGFLAIPDFTHVL